MCWQSKRLSFLLTMTMLGALSNVVAGAQDNPQKTHEALPFRDKVNSQQRLESNSHLFTFKTNPFASALRKNSHAFAAAVPIDLPAELANANLPSSPGKIYSSPALAQTNFLSRSAPEPAFLRNLVAPGLNTSKLRRAKAPDFTHK